MDNAAPERHFDTLAGYRDAGMQLLGRAQTDLVLFDTDLSALSLGSRDATDRLMQFLLGKRHLCLRIALHRFDWLHREAPRLMNLFRDHSHALAVRRTPADLRHLTETFAIADGIHLLARFHCAHSRGKLLLYQSDEAEYWRQRFDEIWQRCDDALAFSPLGL